MARQDLLLFAQKVWPIVEPDHEFRCNWHIELICQDLEALERGDWEREIFNIPPGTMKSLLISVIFPAWVWTRRPSARFLKASYSDHLSVRDNLKLRAIVMSDWYQSHYDVRLVPDQNQKTKFETTDGGWSVATSVGGAGTGEHPDFVLIDDPITALQARSDTERKTACDWMDQTISTRGVARGVRCAVVMQRLHQGDLSGHLKERGGWKQLVLPMRYEVCTCAQQPEGKACPLHAADPGWVPEPRDPRSQPGELLWPDLFSEDKVRQLELDLGPYGAAGQLQQRPAPEGGGLFKREWFKEVSVAPVVARRARGWDTAGTEDAGDYTAGVKISEACGPVKDLETGFTSVQGLGMFFVENVQRDQLGPAGVDKLMLDTAKSDGKACAQREEKEGGSAGKAVVEARAKAMKGFDYKGVAISGDKVVRAKPFRAQCEAGNVYIVRTGDPVLDAWIEPYLTELSQFPTGKNDDQVDGSSAAFNAVLLEPPPAGGVLAGKATW